MGEPARDETTTPRLSHEQIQKIFVRLGEAQIINLDTSIRDLMAPVAEELGPDLGKSLALHIAIMDHYAFVTQ